MSFKRDLSYEDKYECSKAKNRRSNNSAVENHSVHESKHGHNSPNTHTDYDVHKTGLHCSPRLLDGPFPFFRQPREIGCFSIDSDMQFHHDSHQMKYYKQPANPNNVHFDLRAGFKSWVKRDDDIKTYINDLLRWVLCNKIKFLPPGEKNTQKGLFTDFICWRGLLTRLLCTPYENREGWIIAVTRFRGTFYLCEFDTEEKIKQRQNETDEQKVMCYGGYKFEQYLCSSSKEKEPLVTEPVNSIEQFGIVVRGRLESHSLVFGGEVDCRDMNGKTPHYVELKTSREISHSRQEANFKRFKLIKWWAQSFLIGIPTVVCGFRDDDGIVHRLQTFNTMTIPEYCQDIGNCWKSTVCFNFLNKFLKMVKETVTEDNGRLCYVFRQNPHSDITWSLYRSPSEFHFLPEWYISAFDEEENC